MVKKSKGFRARTRKKLKQKSTRPPITRFIQEFEPGEKVVITPEPSSHRGMPFPRFRGCTGEIVGKRGECYIVKVINFKKEKKIIVAPEHLRRLK
jgi:large subunit ribosomal protein L21e